MSLQRAVEVHSKLPSVCRTCLKEEQQQSEDVELYEITGIYLGEGEITAQIQSFEEVLCLFVDDELGKGNDLLPTTICLECVGKARAAFQFIEMCRVTDSVLGQCLSKIEPNVSEKKDEACEESLDEVEPIEEDVAISIEQGKAEGYIITLDDVSIVGVSDDGSMKLEDLEPYDSSGSVPYELEFNRKIEHKTRIRRKPQITRNTERNTTCDVCQKTFSQPQTLTRHKKIHTWDNDEALKCDFCNRPFLRADDLKRHIRTHTNERPYTCDECPKAYKQSSELKDHKTSAHLKDGEPRRIYPCTICSKQLTTRNGLYVHMKAHRGQKNHRCPLCEKRFVTSGELTSHRRHIHFVEENLLRCKFASCSKRFATKVALRRHCANVHDGAKKSPKSRSS